MTAADIDRVLAVADDEQARLDEPAGAIHLTRGDAEIVGAWLRANRVWAGLSQADVAVFVGVDRAMVSYWETGHQVPTGKRLARLARLYSR